jgi:hypothetical protein
LAIISFALLLINFIRKKWGLSILLPKLMGVCDKEHQNFAQK